MRMLRSLVIVLALGLGTFLPGRPAHAAPERAETPNLIQNGSFELGEYVPDGSPDGWTRSSFDPSAVLAWDNTQAYEGSRGVRITAGTPNDAFWLQTVPVQPHTTYLVSGWIRTENVAHTTEMVDRGANLSIMGEWGWYSAPLFGTNDWTYASFVFNAGDRTEVVIAARLGFWAGTTTGTAWFDDLMVTPIQASGPHPGWKILLLVYDTVDFTYTDAAGVTHRYHGVMNQEEKDQAAFVAGKFVEEDIPALDSGNMIPTLTVRYPERPLTELAPIADGWWPDPANTAPERDPAFDSVIVIWDPWVQDDATGATVWIGYGAGLAPDMGTGQTYTSIIIDAVWYGHRNVFKHEWGHNITSFYNALGSAPQPAVNNHIDASSNPYVHCPTGEAYLLVDETDARPIPNSIYNNASGFTHDYYSGTTATPDQPSRCLGITPEAWASGGPVSRPPRPLSSLQQIEALRTTLDSFVSQGDLASSHARQLYAKLDTAGRAIERERDPNAIHSLQLFIQKVQGLVKSGRMLPDEGQVLIEQATALIRQLEE